MPKAIWTSHSLTRGKALLGKWGEKRASVKQAIYDGDTINIEADGNIGIRFLGIDTPEKGCRYPGKETFINIDPHFVDYLKDPFSSQYSDSTEFKNALSPGLLDYLQGKLGADCAENHFAHAKDAKDELEAMISRDVESTGTADDFRFFMAFSYEIMDRYGRLLCWLHQDLPRDQRGDRISYNEEMLKTGKAAPYFIFPNINPFRRKPLLESIPDPSNFKRYVEEEDPSLPQARQNVKDARAQHLGIFDEDDPLMLMPFELRYLARREAPKRYVIDLNADDPVLLKPTNYYQIPNSEDRLFINPEHVPLFREREYIIQP